MDPTVRALDEFLRHEGFVKRLARSLGATGEDADDLVQETWLRAIEHPPISTHSPAGWLGTVMRNLRRDWRAKDAQREKREAAEARMEATAPLQQLVVRQEVHRQIMSALRAIPEAHATAIVLRFFEGLPSREIAKRLHVPVETAKKRLRRGLAELREKLDERFEGGRTGWLAALPLITGASSGSGAGKATIVASAVAALFASTMAKLLIVASIVGVAAVMVFRGGPHEAPPKPPPSVVAKSDEPAEPAKPQPFAVVIKPRAVQEPPEAESQPATAQPAGNDPVSTEVVVTGRLVREQGGPFVEKVVAIELALSGRKRLTKMTRDLELDEVGRFKVKLVHPFVAKDAKAKRELTFMAPTADDRGLVDPVLGARIDLSREIEGGSVDLGDVTMGIGPVVAAGVVEDSRGRPLSDAHVSIRSPFIEPDFSFEERADLKFLENSLRAKSKEDGMFEIHGFAFSGASLEAYKDGYPTAGPVYAKVGATDVRIVMGPRGGALAGQVLLDPEVPVSFIVVDVHCSARGLGTLHADCRADGSFEYKSDRRETVRIVVGAVGVDESLADVPGIDLEPGTVTREPSLNPLDLRGKLKRITVSAVDASGGAVENATVFVQPKEGTNSEYGMKLVNGTAKLMTTGAPIDLRIESHDYRTRRVVQVKSDVRVVLEPALRATITFEPRLPRLPKGAVARVTLMMVNDNPDPHPNTMFNRVIVGRDHIVGTESGSKSRLTRTRVEVELSSDSSATITVPEPGLFEVTLVITEKRGGGMGVKYETTPTVVIVDQESVQAITIPAPPAEVLERVIKSVTRDR